MDSLAIAFLLWIQISSSPSYPGKCQYLSGQEAGVQCGTIPEGAEHFLNETLRSIERNQKGSHFSRGLWVKLGEDWSVKFIALNKFLSQNSEISPVIAQIESLISQGKFKAAGELIDSALAGGNESAHRPGGRRAEQAPSLRVRVIGAGQAGTGSGLTRISL